MSQAISARTVVPLLASAFLVTGVPEAQTAWHVDDDSPNDPGPGDPTVSDPNENGSADHPFDAIQEGTRLPLESSGFLR